MSNKKSVNSRLYKGKDIDSDGDGTVDSADSTTYNNVGAGGKTGEKQINFTRRAPAVIRLEKIYQNGDTNPFNIDLHQSGSALGFPFDLSVIGGSGVPSNNEFAGLIEIVMATRIAADDVCRFIVRGQYIDDTGTLQTGQAYPTITHGITSIDASISTGIVIDSGGNHTYNFNYTQIK